MSEGIPPLQFFMQRDDQAEMRDNLRRENMYQLIDELTSKQLATLMTILNSINDHTATYLQGMIAHELRRVRMACMYCGEDRHETAGTKCELTGG